MSENAPTISVLMTAYNREAYIGDAISSVLKSDFDDFELIIVDDASNDRTVEIANEYASGDKRIHVHRNSKNLGDYPNRNHAASLARGRYMKYVDSDDMVYPWTLGAMVNCISPFPNAGLALAAIPEYGRPHPQELRPEEAYERHFFHRELFYRAPGSAIISRMAFETIGGFSGRRHVGDFEFWLKICARFNMVTMPTGLTWDRVHENQEKSLHNPSQKEFMTIERIVDAMQDTHCPLNNSQLIAALVRLRNNLKKKFIRSFFRPRNIVRQAKYTRLSISLLNTAINDAR